MQNTDPSHIVKMLDAVWKENSTLALKLVFQLRDVRRGKSAKVEFYHCLSWLMRNHPETLMKNYLIFRSAQGKTTRPICSSKVCC